MNEPKIAPHFWIQPGGRIDELKGIKGNQDYFFHNTFKETWKFYMRKLILNRIYAQYKDLSNKIIIKEPHGSLAADIISECLPNSKIIILLRDGRDVIDSQVDGFSKGGWIIEEGGRHLTEDMRMNFIKHQANLCYCV